MQIQPIHFLSLQKGIEELVHILVLTDILGRCSQTQGQATVVRESCQMCNFPIKSVARERLADSQCFLMNVGK